MRVLMHSRNESFVRRMLSRPFVPSSELLSWCSLGGTLRCGIFLHMQPSSPGFSFAAYKTLSAKCLLSSGSQSRLGIRAAVNRGALRTSVPAVVTGLSFTKKRLMSHLRVESGVSPGSPLVSILLSS